MSLPVTPLALSDEDREELVRLAGFGPPRLALRARIVLACAQGRENKAVAAELRTTEHNVTRWRGRFIEGRLGGLHDEKRTGRPPSVLLDKVEEVVTATLEELPPGRDALVTGLDGPAQRPVAVHGRADLAEIDLKPHLTDGFKLSSDPLFVEKAADVVGLCHNPPEKAVVLCVDEKSQVQAYPGDDSGVRDSG